MAQQGKGFSTQTDGLSSIPRAHVVEKPDSYKLSSDRHVHAIDI